MWKLQTNLSNANHMQNMARSNNTKTNRDHAHTHKAQSIWLQRRGIAIDAIIKVEQYVENANHGAEILLMDLSKAFGAINRTLLWETLYKEGIPIDMTKHIRQGRRDTKLAPKYKGKYGAPSADNRGIFQG